MSAYWKIPLQVLVLLIGVLVFVFYLFDKPPMLFNPVHEARVKQSAACGPLCRRRAAVLDGVCQSPRRSARARGGREPVGASVCGGHVP